GWKLFRLPKGGPPRKQFRPKVSGKLHSKERDFQAVTYHYNISNDFYALWLDSRMLYTCSYKHTPDHDLETAQAQKIDYVCRKLRLKPGERLLDVGCGWGALTYHAAKHYGANVLGVTVSAPQVELGNQRLREAGLADRARLAVLDYRDVKEPNGFDKIAAI